MITNTPKTRSLLRQLSLVILTVLVGFSSWLTCIPVAEAIPAFARKYEISCNACHTRQPRLNTYGQRFMENGYQLPGTRDGGTKKKALLGDPITGVTLDRDIGNYFAMRLRAEIQLASFGDEDATESTTDPDIVFPNVINLFFGGTATKDISYFFEAEYAPAEGHEAALAFERSMLMFSNLGGDQVANIKVGIFDPSSFFSFPTHRQQMSPIFADAHTDEYPPEINRIPILPLAFASKMYGLTTGPGANFDAGSLVAANEYDGADTTLEDNFAILPFQPYLYNAPFQKGISVHGRPFGNNILYQVGIAQNETAGDEAETRWDTYAMLRWDLISNKYSALQVSGFIYNAPEAARPTLRIDSGGVDPTPEYIFADDAVDWLRTGIAARWQYRAMDMYITYIKDEIDQPVFSGTGSTSTWETEATGLSMEVDYLISNRWMVGLRYDQMSPGGLKRGMPGWNKDLNLDASFLGVIGKYYPRPNIGLYARYHQNLESSDQLPNALGGEEHPARNLTSMFALGVDMAF